MQAPVYGGTPMYAYGLGGLPQHFNPNAAVSSYQQPLPPLPPGWEILYDPSGRMYFGCPSRRHVQWKFPHHLVPAAEAPQQPMSSSAPIEKPAYIPHASVQVQRDIEEVDAMDSQGYWYQAFIVKQDEKEALVHFSGWGKETAEKIQISDFPKRIRARSATAATGQGILPSREDVRKMFGLPAYVPSASPAQLPVGWEVLYDHSGKVYYGNRALMKVQWEHPSEGVTSGKRHLANQYAALLLRQR